MSPNDTDRRADPQRIQDLLGAAALLLVRGSELRAVRLLHLEVSCSAGQLELSPLHGKPLSRLAVEEEHRQLLDTVSQRPTREERPFSLLALRRRLPTWVSWAIVGLVGAGLMLRYAFALVERAMWQNEHPEGAWVSRYYDGALSGESALVRYDVGVKYDWGTGPPASGMPKVHWRARWDTCLVVTTETVVPLRLRAQYRATLYVDGNKTLDARRNLQKKKKVVLPPGVHPLRVDFRKTRGNALLRLDGLDFAGTDAYHFQRPTLDGDEVRCQGSLPPS